MIIFTVNCNFPYRLCYHLKCVLSLKFLCLCTYWDVELLEQTLLYLLLRVLIIVLWAIKNNSMQFINILDMQLIIWIFSFPKKQFSFCALLMILIELQHIDIYLCMGVFSLDCLNLGELSKEFDGKFVRSDLY